MPASKQAVPGRTSARYLRWKSESGSVPDLQSESPGQTNDHLDLDLQRGRSQGDAADARETWLGTLEKRKQRGMTTSRVSGLRSSM